MNSQPIQIQKWDHATSPLSEAAVRERYNPPEDYRISLSRREAGTRYPESTRVGIVYVLSGSCSWDRDGNTVVALAGDVLQLAEGTYQFEVLGDEPCETIHVWNLKELWSQQNQPAEQGGGGQAATRSEST